MDFPMTAIEALNFVSSVSRESNLSHCRHCIPQKGLTQISGGVKFGARISAGSFGVGILKADELLCPSIPILFKSSNATEQG